MNLGGDFPTEIVIDGAGQCVGSYRRNFASRSQPDVQRRPLVAEASALSSAPRSLRYFRSRWTCRLRTAETGPLVLTLAIYENGLVTKTGGENGGSPTHIRFYSEKMLPAFQLKAAQGVLVVKELKIDLEFSWAVDHLQNYALMRGNLDGLHRFYLTPITKRVPKYY